MYGLRVLGVCVVASLVGGCAGTRGRQDMARLQSQVGLLDERVTQLERSSGVAGFSAAPVAEPMMDGDLTIGGTHAARKRAPAQEVASTKSSIKPTTREIQQALKNAGFYQGSLDGKTGPVTREAVKEFQRVHGLNDDGVVGRQTWAKLKAYADLSASSGELNAAEPLK